jgi:hypothetical protein
VIDICENFAGYDSCRGNDRHKNRFLFAPLVCSGQLPQNLQIPFVAEDRQAFTRCFRNRNSDKAQNQMLPKQTKCAEQLKIR